MKIIEIFAVIFFVIVYFNSCAQAKDKRIKISVKEVIKDDFGFNNKFFLKNNDSSDLINSKIDFKFNQLENDILRNGMRIKEIIFYPKSYGCDKKMDLNKVFNKYSEILVFLDKKNKNVFGNIDYQLRIIHKYCHLYESDQKYWEFTVVPILEDSKGKKIEYKWKE